MVHRGLKIVSTIKNFLALLAINKAVFWGILSKLSFAAGGLVIILVIAVYFTPELQGYYFTFYSLVSLQIFVELGLSAVIINFASHEWAKLEFDKYRKIVGDTNALARLKSLAKGVFYWYTIGSLALLLVMGSVGYIFFSISEQVGINWVWPWFAFCLLSCLNLMILPVLALLEGCGQVANVYFFRFVQEVLRTTSTWMIIVLGGGLWALSGSTLAIVVWAAVYLSARYFNFFRSFFTPIAGEGLSWWKDVWPMQWRIAVSWLSSYFIFALFVPVLFYFKGAVVAGQMGMTWRVSQALMLVASMWVVTRAPQFGMLIAKKDYRELDKVMFHSTGVALVIAALGAIIIFGTITALYTMGHSLALRFLSPWSTALILAAAVLLLISTAQATYLRAHKKEPFMLLAVITAVIMLFLTIVTGKIWGAEGISLSYFSVMAFIVIPFATLIWFRCRNKWHPDDLLESTILADERF